MSMSSPSAVTRWVGVDLRIRSSTGASVARSRAAVDRTSLRSGVADRVTWRAASTLERVVQSHPVADQNPVISSFLSDSGAEFCLPGFVGQSPAQVVWGRSSTGDRRVQHNHTVILGVAGVRRREGRVSQQSRTGTRNEPDTVDVESIGSTQPQLVLHCSLVRATRTNVSDRPKKVSGSRGWVIYLSGPTWLNQVGLRVLSVPAR